MKPDKDQRKKRFRLPRISDIKIDLSRSDHRRNFLFVNLILLSIGIAFLIGGVKGYEYTESSEFCGTVCHVMEPQFVRFESSPHANIECAKCHIGPGASFFVKSKIDGMRQVYAVLTDTYNNPIKSPVHDLRPARETCETCHSPTTFKDNIVKTHQHFDEDEANTPVNNTLILKMGGWQENTGISQGIHWHITSNVYYIAADEQRQVIMWVGVEQDDGTIKEYFSRDLLNMDRKVFIEQAREEGELRLMDCIDCHNRTAHYIPYPEQAVDKAIDSGLISRDIPYIRAKSIELLSAPFPSQEEAYTAIEGLTDYYDVRLASGGGSSEDDDSSTKVLQSVEKLKEIYTSTNFPAMNLNWETNPNNERHTPSPGCFRCHDDKHVSLDVAGNEANVVSMKCNLCHTVPIVGRGTEMVLEAPVIVGPVPTTHADFRWTIEHRTVTDAETQDCYQCHGQGFCSNEACHNLSHPPDMLFTHAEEYYQRGDQVCYTCHQNILCSRCHPGGIVTNP